MDNGEKRRLAEALRRSVLDSYREEYRELSQVWRDLDAKAQGLFSVSGIFLAGVFAFMAQRAQEHDPLQGGALLAATLSLFAAVAYALRSYRTESAPYPPLGDRVRGLVDDIIATGDPEEWADSIAAYYNDLSRLYEGVNTVVHERNEQKAERLRKGHEWVILAIGCFTLFAVASYF